jgi:hypothetical protein
MVKVPYYYAIGAIFLSRKIVEVGNEIRLENSGK